MRCPCGHAVWWASASSSALGTFAESLQASAAFGLASLSWAFWPCALFVCMCMSGQVNIAELLHVGVQIVGLERMLRELSDASYNFWEALWFQ